MDSSAGRQNYTANYVFGPGATKTFSYRPANIPASELSISLHDPQNKYHVPNIYSL